MAVQPQLDTSSLLSQFENFIHWMDLEQVFPQDCIDLILSFLHQCDICKMPRKTFDLHIIWPRDKYFCTLHRTSHHRTFPTDKGVQTKIIPHSKCDGIICAQCLKQDWAWYIPRPQCVDADNPKRFKTFDGGVRLLPRHYHRKVSDFLDHLGIPITPIEERFGKLVRKMEEEMDSREYSKFRKLE